MSQIFQYLSIRSPVKIVLKQTVILDNSTSEILRLLKNSSLIRHGYPTFDSFPRVELEESKSHREFPRRAENKEA